MQQDKTSNSNFSIIYLINASTMWTEEIRKTNMCFKKENMQNNNSEWENISIKVAWLEGNTMIDAANAHFELL